jgi:hypothetical protein
VSLAVTLFAAVLAALAYVAAAGLTHRRTYAAFVDKEGHSEAQAMGLMCAALWPVWIAFLGLRALALLAWAGSSSRVFRLVLVRPLTWAWRLGASDSLPKATAKIKEAP